MTRVCLATEGEQLSVECGLEKCVTTVTCCSYGHTRGWGDREADSGHCDQHTAGHERGHLDTHSHPYFDGTGDSGRNMLWILFFAFDVFSEQSNDMIHLVGTYKLLWIQKCVIIYAI